MFIYIVFVFRRFPLAMRTAHLTIAHSAFHPIRRYHFLLPIAKSLLHCPCYFRPTMFVPTMTRPAALSVNSSFDSGFSGSLLSGMSASVLSSNGDYVVLSQTLQKQREAAQLASSNVATTLLRLGEHHVRNQQYDDAMDAFAEALHVRRSAYRSLVSGGSDAEAIDTIMPILSQIGNVHSLRGEHNEAMRYYNEVMSLRSARASLTTPSDSNDFLDVVGNSTRSTGMAYGASRIAHSALHRIAPHRTVIRFVDQSDSNLFECDRRVCVHGAWRIAHGASRTPHRASCIAAHRASQRITRRSCRRSSLEPAKWFLLRGNPGGCDGR